MTLNEANTRKQLIDRALESVGWKGVVVGGFS